jgi:hypothetical protein
MATVRRFTFLKRREGLSREEFHDAWRAAHRANGQAHVHNEVQPPVGELVPEPLWDGLLEAGPDAREAFEGNAFAALSGEAGGIADPGQVVEFLAEARIVLDGPARGVKILSLPRRKGGLSPATVRWSRATRLSSNTPTVTCSTTSCPTRSAPPAASCPMTAYRSSGSTASTTRAPPGTTRPTWSSSGRTRRTSSAARPRIACSSGRSSLEGRVAGRCRGSRRHASASAGRTRRPASAWAAAGRSWRSFAGPNFRTRSAAPSWNPCPIAWRACRPGAAWTRAVPSQSDIRAATLVLHGDDGTTGRTPAR